MAYFLIMDFLHLIILGAVFLLGVITGGLSNVTSGGNGVFTIFILTKFTGLTIQQSVGTVLASSTIMVAIGAVTFYKRKQVDKQLSLTLGVPGVVSAFLTASIVSSIQSTLLERAFGLFTLFIALFTIYRLVRDKGGIRGISRTLGVFHFSPRVSATPLSPDSGLRSTSQQPAEVQSRWRGKTPSAILMQVTLGLLIGIATGLFGVGGAVLTLAALLLIFKLKAKIMLGTSLMASLLRYAGGTAGYLMAGQVNLFWFLVLTIGGAIGSIVGARFITKEATKDSYVQIIVIVLFFFISYEFLVK